ncbi:MAG: diphthamide biosynthesis enzyme Dph2 [Candidatus Bathyarchaeia archaeon]|nr:diphthamide biosynthesis enzyme Dph2 [Candidatus Bathyarchaeota archaeon]
MSKELFDLEIEQIQKTVQQHNAKKVLIQLPEGLKPQAPKLAEAIEKAGAQAIISGDPCYGACDLMICEAENLGVDLVIHCGHSELIKPKTRVPIVYFHAKANLDIKPAVKKAVQLLKPWTKIGLATTIHHVDQLEQARKILEKAQKTVFIGDTGHGKSPGQILGCDYTNAKAISDKVEAYLFIGGGQFHPLGLSLATMKPTVVADPFGNAAYTIEVEAQRTLQKRYASIKESQKAQNFGIIIGLKPGQTNIQAATNIKTELESNGKKATLLALREITPDALMQFPTIEAYVNTSCPRIALDGSSVFKKPVLTIAETHVALGKTKWEDLLEKGLL